MQEILHRFHIIVEMPLSANNLDKNETNETFLSKSCFDIEILHKMSSNKKSSPF